MAEPFPKTESLKLISIAEGADVTQAILDLGAAIDNAKVNGVTLIDDGYIRTSLLSTDVLVVGENVGELATKDSVDLATSEVTNKSLTNLDSSASLKLNGIEEGANVNTIDAGDGLAALDTNADGMLSNLDSLAYFPGTVNFNPFGSILLRSGLPAGWFRQYTLAGSNPLSYDATEEALSIDNDLDCTVTSSAFPVVSGAQYKIKIKEN